MAVLSDVDKTLAVLEFAVQGVGVSFVAGAGIFCNALCLLVLCQPNLKKGHGSVNIILISMAVIDILVSQKLIFKNLELSRRVFFVQGK